MTDLERAAVLMKRLEDGREKIEMAKQSGRNTAFLEEFWINLLHEYNDVCAELARTEQAKSND